MRTPPEWVFHVLTWSLAAIGLITLAHIVPWGLELAAPSPMRRWFIRSRRNPLTFPDAFNDRRIVGSRHLRGPGLRSGASFF